jgi:hypothetical protein
LADRRRMKLHGKRLAHTSHERDGHERLSRVSWNLRWRSPPEARRAVGIG